LSTDFTYFLAILLFLAAGPIIETPASNAEGPYPPSPVIADLVLDWSTHQRHAQGSDNFQLTWADDDHQYGAWGDGGGFGGSNSDGRVGLGFARIEGGWDSYKSFNVWGGKDPENPAQFTGKSWGTICVGGVLYSWITPDRPDAGDPRDHYRYVELAKSTDHGTHWTKADWRWWRDDNLIVPTFLVYGKNNAGARDDNVYAYFIRPQDVKVTQPTFGLNVHKPGVLFLARVRRDRIFAGRDAYEWFAGISGGKPTWSPLADKRPVFENPDGTGWCVSASYNPGLGRYLLATEHSVSHSGVMSLFDAPEPWGPWTTVKYWTPNKKFGGVRPGSTLDWADNVFFFSFAPKWLSDDGRSFTLVFTGGGNGKNNDSLNTVRGTFQLRNPASPTIAAHAGRATGPLRIHPQNPRYFTDGTKAPDGSLKTVYLTGAHTWNNLVDMGRSDPPEKFDFPAYLDFLERYDHNFVRLWAWDSTTWDTRANGTLGKDFIHNASPLPWVRTGPGNALDGKPKFDLTKFQPEYFERLRSRVVAAGQRGIYVSAMLFEGWGLMHGNRRRNTQDGWAWRSHPFNPANNVNGLVIEGADALIGRVHTLRNSEANKLQVAYIRKVVDTVNDLDNVLYEVINEGGEKEWNWWVIETIHEYERTKPKQHPVGNTGHGAERLASMLASPADWISPGRADGFAEDPPAWDGPKISLLDTDHIWGVGGNHAWVWRSFLRGHNPIFMDPYDGSVLGDRFDPKFGPLRRNMGYALRYARKMNLAAMIPHGELASTEFCLADPDKEYLVYLPKGGEVTVDLSGASGSLTVEWFNPNSGDATPGESTSGGQKRSFKPPFDGDAVLYLSKISKESP
jgi:hypothetical protein